MIDMVGFLIFLIIIGTIAAIGYCVPQHIIDKWVKESKRRKKNEHIICR